jgi:hypothetical protein
MSPPTDTKTHQPPHDHDDDDDHSSHKPPKPASGPPGSGGLENRSAIPSAGGERLGEKHWGESKIVPDLPKKPEETKVASAEGQPTCEFFGGGELSLALSICGWSRTDYSGCCSGDGEEYG